MKVRNCKHPDFLVPAHLFLRSLKVRWFIGTKVKIKYNTIAQDGVTVRVETSIYRLQSLHNASAEWPESPWECLNLRWICDDNGDRADISLGGEEEGGGGEAVALELEENQPLSSDFKCCPWEAIPMFNEAGAYSDAWNNVKRPSIDAELCDKVEAHINRMIAENEHQFGIFVFEVDPTEVPSYHQVIHVPIYLDLIRRRLQNRYYRQVTDVAWHGMAWLALRPDILVYYCCC